MDDIVRAQRKQAAEAEFMRGGASGLAACAAAAAAVHAALQYGWRPPAYVAANWRLKLFLGCAASVAGFAVGAEKGWLRERDRLLLIDAAADDAAADAAAAASAAAARRVR